MAENAARRIGLTRAAETRPELGLVAGTGAGDPPIVLLLSPSRDLLGIGPIGWAGAAILLAVIALATAAFSVRVALPETKPLVVALALETPPPPPAPSEPPPTPSAESPPASSEPLPRTPSGEPPPEAATPAAEEPSTLPAPSEVISAPPPVAAPPLEALPQAPPPKPRAPAPRQRAAAAATKLPPTGPTQDAAVPIVPPRPISGMTDNAVPDYPVQASQHHVEGEVLLRVEVSATGDLVSVTIARSSGNDILDQAALLVVRHWRFSPATRGGEPVPGTAEVPISSRIDD